MYKGRDIIGKPVVSYDLGEKFDIVEDLIFDQDSNQLLGFLVSESSWFSSAQVLLLKDVQVIGPDAVITASQAAIAKVSEIPAIHHILEHNNILKGTRILTMDGRDLGMMIDLYFDEHTGDVEGYEVSGGLFADAYSGRSFVPAPQTLKIGRDVAFVPTQTAQLMEEQVGGIRGAMQTVSDRVQETAQVTGDKIQELGRITSEKAQETAQVTGDKIQELGRSATTSIANIIVDPEEQKAFVIGKTVEHDVVTLGGQSLVLQGQIVTSEIADSADNLGVLDQLYRATGGSLSNKLSERFGNAVASLSIDQAQGMRIRQIVRSDEGSIIAAQGQIVTQQVIQRAKTYHQEQALLQAVGLSTDEAVRNSTSSAMTVAGDRLKSTSQKTGEQLQAGAKGLWAHVKVTASEIQDRGTQAIEEKRIKGALGRAVTRVILDQQDDVILNVGELITHQAIASARQSQVLDLLLSSVYNEKPQLSLEDLRAPQAGSAALSYSPGEASKSLL
ncbi:PRC-barrel domain-containing protein [Neosynechococcus sphagnicola]|uniref:PRC-barrel domain-containing protein n=1 Tax=Neosynechococcus sphagnicola TaxID=1501145 RepID=UPI000690177E|nr:PRC-barrel domain-containing protein [Neosynechococcus sphagnicola]